MVDFLPSRNGKVYLLHLVTGQPTQSTDQSHSTLVTSANGERHLAAGQVLHKIRDLSPIEDLSRKEYPSRARITRLTEMGGDEETVLLGRLRLTSLGTAPYRVS